MSGRRDFLRGLVSLPLIGGSVSLIGAPSAAAEEATLPLMLQYANWLFMERRMVCIEVAAAAGDWPNRDALESVSFLSPGRDYPEFHFPRHGYWTDVPPPSTRAAVVLAASGFDWRPSRAG